MSACCRKATALSGEREIFSKDVHGGLCPLRLPHPRRKNSPKLLRSPVAVFSSRASPSVLAAPRFAARRLLGRVPTSTPLRSDSPSSLGRHSQHSFVSLFVLLQGLCSSVSWLVGCRKAPCGPGRAASVKGKVGTMPSSTVNTHSRAGGVGLCFLFSSVPISAERDLQPRAALSTSAEEASTFPTCSGRTDHTSTHVFRHPVDMH